MEQAHFIVNEQVHVVNLNDGERFKTYVIPNERHSGIIALNGPTARKSEIGNQVFIFYLLY